MSSTKRIYITEEQFKKMVSTYLPESVYVNGINGRKANLTYQKGNDWSRGNLAAADKIKTDKMDTLNGDTYQVKLKGGITSYNITSINGTEVMHYFKRYFDHQKTEISLSDKEGNVKSYELEMMASEFKSFMNQFVQKVGFVVNYALKNSGDEVNAISIYPVPSSSNFNEKMAEELTSMSVNGLPVQVINKDMFVKDLRNLEKDQEFIDKNKDYYNSNLGDKGNITHPINNYVDKNLSKYKALLPAEKNIMAMNDAIKKILAQINNIKQAQKKNDRDFTRMIDSLVENYKKYYDNYAAILKIKYNNPVSVNGESTARIDDVATILKYSKGPSIESRTKYVWDIVKKRITHGKRMDISPVTGKIYGELPIQYWVKTPFQIKDMTNPERMALRNIYNPNMDAEMVQAELEKIKGTAFVIFDDNISGGATLSDICYQCKKLGIENVIPITFGKMQEKWTFGMLPINKPEGGFNL